MGRRALRKPDPALDLSRDLLTLADIPQPWNQAAIYDRIAPLEIEVGSGKGLFLTGAAQAKPEHNFLGIEISERYAHFSAARLARAKLSNARMIEGDGERLLREMLPAACCVAVHVYFPDPWWKARHRKRRVLNEIFVKEIERVLIPGGSLHFWTDVEEYYLATLELLAAETKLSGPLPVPEASPEHDLDYRTHFERRTRLHGEPVYRSEFRKG